MRVTLGVAAAAGVAAGVPCVSVVAQPEFRGLGIPAGALSSYVNALSADGRIAVGVVSHSFALDDRRAIRWSAETGIQYLESFPGGGRSWAWAVSADGSVIVGAATRNGVERAVRWTAATGIQDLGTLPGHYSAGAVGVSADGTVIAGFSEAGSGGYFPVVWRDGSGIQSLGTRPGWIYPRASAISADGSFVVGQALAPNGDQPFRWTAASGLQELFPAVPGFDNDIGDVTADGSFVVGRYAFRGYRYSAAGGMEFLGGWTASNNTNAMAVNADGSIVGGVMGGHAATWSSREGWLDLHRYLPGVGVSLAGWTVLYEVRALTPDGRTIAGTGNRGGATAEAWIVRLPTVGPPCVANCDGTTTEPVLNINDFVCFQGKFAAGDPAANCDGSTTSPILTVNDFVCFQSAYAAGCP